MKKIIITNATLLDSKNGEKTYEFRIKIVDEKDTEIGRMVTKPIHGFNKEEIQSKLEAEIGKSIRDLKKHTKTSTTTNPLESNEFKFDEKTSRLV